MEIEFIKMHSCGNDYILINTLKNIILNDDLLPDMAIQICSRHFGVGAEGSVLIMPGTKKSLKMICLGPDGLDKSPCPLALRCVGRYAFDAGLVSSESFTIETSAGTQKLEVIDSRNIIIASGPPYYWNQERELKERIDEGFIQTLTIGNKDFNYTPVFLYTPHSVIFISDYSFNLHEFGTKIEDIHKFPNNTKLELVRVFSREEMSIRVWGMGMGEPLASETGACAAVVAAVLNGFTDRDVLVHLEGGNLYIQWSDVDNCLYASGPADYVFTGTYYYEEGEPGED